MATELNKDEWRSIIRNPNITNETDISILSTFYSFENHAARSTEVAKILGFNTAAFVNGEVARLAKRIAKETNFDIEFSIRQTRKIKYWDLFFTGWEDRNYFIWKLKPELAKALEEEGIIKIDQFPEEIPFESEGKLVEGAKKTIIVNTYERNPLARRKCIDFHKPICSVCNFDFEKVYGDFGKGFIHVHHLTPISQIGENYQIDPINDLRPVCPNCHSMLHKTNPALSIDELISIIKTSHNNGYHK
jgi:5-methylcytosine-specific restriction enzyme A